MKRIAAVALLFVGLAPVVVAQDAAKKIEPVEHSYVLHNFHTESGVVLPEAKVVYGTFGHLNAAGDNAILLPSHYMANMHGYGWLIGPGKVFDPERDYLVATELFGNGRSSSPSNTPKPYDGPRFPVTTIRDNVTAVHELLTKELGVKHLKAVVGFSMGAQQAFQWAVSYPDYMDYAVATSGTAKTYGHGIVRNESEIGAITTDEAFKGGEYTAEPEKGIQEFGLVWTGWLFGQEWWRRELWKTEKPNATLGEVIDDYRKNFIPHADANNLILQLRTWEKHDVGTTPGFNGDLAKALGSIKAKVLYMPSETDLYFPVGDAKYEAQYIPHCTLLPIPSVWGHPAGAGASPEDERFLNEHIAAFLNIAPHAQ